MGKKLLKIKKVHFKEDEAKFQWYTVVTMFNHERKVAEALRNRFENMGAADKLKEVFVPIREWEEEVPGRRKKDGTLGKPRTLKKSENVLESGYIFIHMIMTDETWNIVRQTTGVAGWLKNADGMPGDVPVEDILKWKDALGVGKEARAEIAKEFNAKIGDTVRIINGPFKDFYGEVTDINDMNVNLVVENGMNIEIGLLDLEVI